MFQIQHDWGSDDSCWFSFGSSSSSSNNDARTVHARLSFENGRPKAFDSERFALTQNASTSLFHVRDEVSNCEVDVQRASSSFKIGSNVLTCLDVNTAGELGVVGDEAGNLSIFDANDGTVRHSLPNAHLLDVNRVSFFPSGQVVLTCGGDMLLKVWDALEGVLACTLKGWSVFVFFSLCQFFCRSSRRRSVTMHHR
jgi:WD40 repeat protein